MNAFAQIARSSHPAAIRRTPICRGAIHCALYVVITHD
jgi:hypothetical protein